MRDLTQEQTAPTNRPGPRWRASAPWLSALLVVLPVLARGAMLEVVPTHESQFIAPHGAVSIDVSLITDDPTLTGLGLTLHFDSMRLSFVDIDQVLQDSLIQVGSPTVDVIDADGDSNTDLRVTVAWASLAGDWPGTNTILLYRANFEATAAFADETLINFTAMNSLPLGASLQTTSAVVAIPGSAPWALLMAGLALTWRRRAATARSGPDCQAT